MECAPPYPTPPSYWSEEEAWNDLRSILQGQHTGWRLNQLLCSWFGLNEGEFLDRPSAVWYEWMDWMRERGWNHEEGQFVATPPPSCQAILNALDRMHGNSTGKAKAD